MGKSSDPHASPFNERGLYHFSDDDMTGGSVWYSIQKPSEGAYSTIFSLKSTAALSIQWGTCHNSQVANFWKSHHPTYRSDKFQGEEIQNREREWMNKNNTYNSSRFIVAYEYMPSYHNDTYLPQKLKIRTETQ